MLIVSRQLQIPLAEFEITFARSSGPGGQNVNKVNSKAVLRWAAGRSPCLPEAVRGAVSAEIRQSADDRGRVARDQSALSRCTAKFAGLPGETPRDAAGRRACAETPAGNASYAGFGGTPAAGKTPAVGRQAKPPFAGGCRHGFQVRYQFFRQLVIILWIVHFGPVGKSMFHGPESGY